ncbi:MAG TPA: sugar phosphate isomerase/epimerase [Candidatus Saccharimonadales bacterium]|nr:sugar phosphate isomerase/epimerase [Candidatus Saccharimonadales bacterium]
MKFFSIGATFFWVMAAGLAQPASADSFSDRIGLQLESFNGPMHKNIDSTLEKVHRLGFKYVELVGDYGLSPEALKAELKSHGLIATSAHFPYAEFRDHPAELAAKAKALGLTYAGCPSLPQHEHLDEKGCREAIAIFNHAGEILAAQGIKFFYHPHGYEFKPHGEGTLFDLLVAQTNPKFVHFQMDIFWIVHAGQDPRKLLDRYSDRWVSMHLKDMRKGAAIAIDSKTERGNFVPIGQGQIDMVAALRTARRIGISSFFIEDESASPEKEIPQSVQFLRDANW